MARARGCSDSDSTAAANESRLSSSPSTAWTPVTRWLAFVSVPVLSNSTRSMTRTCSRASLSLTRIPLRAASPVEIETTKGMASPRACGQAITSTDTVRTTASSGLPASSQAAAVTAATATAR